ncbi:PLP-dependent aminotransferase family protein [Motiliproteus coralliicola]|uniref:PLP-dependent aminotransferase family protein n=1 Tax=Motiliproteus coralliicola TaxID=2283196 RepID=A0A369WKU2_9GAMM|nr:PLP-dependent aminotransferase family protein [Motiliproteus coralliicola]RDE22680.1 PLP-dependent aminotransferase family protein [Motiliproteus coralliicola]
MSDFLYRQLVRELTEEIRTERRPVGSKMPSIRTLSQQRGLSKSTVLTAYDRLEADGLISARPRSGYYVNGVQATDTLPITKPLTSKPESTPLPVTSGQVLVDIMERGAAFDLIGHQKSEIGKESLRRCLARAQRKQTTREQNNYDEPAGLYELRSQIANRLLAGASHLNADEIIITAGCQHALLLALMATTQHGDVVAVESPGFYGVFQLFEALGLKALELPSSPETGLSPEALELSLQHWDIKALVVSPSYSTPTGASMPEANKQRILELAQSRDLPIIEDDIYGELSFNEQRPRTLHSYDKTGQVLLCSSVSKSLSRDLRVGWIAPGRYRERVKQLKLVTSLASCQAQQRGLVDFLQEGSFDRHLRVQRQKLRQQYQQLLEMLGRYLPTMQSCSRPEGGLALWVELPEPIDTLELYGRSLQQGIILTPGRLFTAQERYRNALRISFAFPWTEHRQDALKRLGQLVAQYPASNT